ncbi:DUF3955 domain-containing protein [Verminephrobacter eiseniae]|uniref:DUF3955 domain-containing protein n=1 Tax=Verminephrobacter eiseniae TaxID=364317 RepID=UPI0022385275|nr:DUF3955 domain-containing protein [Verminephrobacter eiseniae]MCW5238685.1 DUF3955 domain-containing protein [Verminephrobacter eiseniae]
MNHPTRYIPAALLLFGSACFAGFAAIGGSVAPDGQLQEPFALLPLGWLCTVLGALGLLPPLIRRLRRKP